MKDDPAAMSAEELREHVAALRADLEEAKEEKAYLQRLAKTQMPGHQIERYEAEIASLEAAVAEAKALLAGRWGTTG